MRNITLSTEQYMYGISMGVKRNYSAERDGKHPGRVKSKWTHEQTHMLGCLGELAAMEAIGIEADLTIDTYKGQSDLPGCVEVRTRTSHNWDLKVTKRDDPDQSFVLVTCDWRPDNPMPPRDFVVRGWLSGDEAQQEQFVRDFGGYGVPAFFVPQSELHTLETLELCDE